MNGRDRPLQIQKSIEFFAYAFNWSFTVVINIFKKIVQFKF